MTLTIRESSYSRRSPGRSRKSLCCRGAGESSDLTGVAQLTVAGDHEAFPSPCHTTSRASVESGEEKNC